MPRGAGPAALAGRLRLPLLRPCQQEACHWFAAIHLIVTAKNGISSVELGVKQPMGREAGGDGLRPGLATLNLAGCAPALRGTSPEGRPRKLMAPSGFRKREIARGAKHWLAPGAAVVTDGLGCWSALDEIACSHRAIRTGSGRQAARMAVQMGERRSATSRAPPGLIATLSPRCQPALVSAVRTPPRTQSNLVCQDHTTDTLSNQGLFSSGARST